MQALLEASCAAHACHCSGQPELSSEVFLAVILRGGASWQTTAVLRAQQSALACLTSSCVLRGSQLSIRAQIPHIAVTPHELECTQAVLRALCQGHTEPMQLGCRLRRALQGARLC